MLAMGLVEYESSSSSLSLDAPLEVGRLPTASLEGTLATGLLAALPMTDGAAGVAPILAAPGTTEGRVGTAEELALLALVLEVATQEELEAAADDAGSHVEDILE